MCPRGLNDAPSGVGALLLLLLLFIYLFIYFQITLYNLHDATGSNTPVEKNSCLDCESVIPRSPLTALVGCEHHEIGAVQFVLLDRHLTPKESRCLGQIVSSRCELSISNTPVR